MLNTILVDATTLFELIHYPEENYVLRPPSYFLGKHRGAKDQHLCDAFSGVEPVGAPAEHLRGRLLSNVGVLEAWVLYEHIVADQVSVKSLEALDGARSNRLFSELSKIFQISNYTNQHRDEIQSNINDFIRYFGGHAVRNFLHDLEGHRIIDEGAGDLALKDTLMKGFHASVFGNSCNSPFRAIFYHELANQMGCALYLHPQKQLYLKVMKRGLHDEAIRLLESISISIKDLVFPEDYELPVPPLAYFIIETAFREDCSLLEAAMNLRNDREIQSLRAMLMDLVRDQQINPIRFPRRVEKKSKEIADRLISRSRYELPWLCSRRLNLSEAPAIGSILKVAGMGEVSVPDIVLWERPYVSVFEKWATQNAAKA